MSWPHANRTEDLRQIIQADVDEFWRFVLNHMDPNSHLQQAGAKRLAEWQRAANLGWPQAQWLVGMFLKSSDHKGPNSSRLPSVSKDEIQARRWIQKAAEAGYAPAQFEIGWYFHFGKGGLIKNVTEALRWVQKAADQGLAAAQFMIGRALLAGRDVTLNPEQGLKYITQAADQGHLDAQFDLAVRYDSAFMLGRRRREDAIQALRWYRLPAAHGDEYAKKRHQALIEELENM